MVLSLTRPPDYRRHKKKHCLHVLQPHPDSSRNSGLPCSSLPSWLPFARAAPPDSHLQCSPSQETRSQFPEQTTHGSHSHRYCAWRVLEIPLLSSVETQAATVCASLEAGGPPHQVLVLARCLRYLRGVRPRPRGRSVAALPLPGGAGSLRRPESESGIKHPEALGSIRVGRFGPPCLQRLSALGPRGSRALAGMPSLLVPAQPTRGPAPTQRSRAQRARHPPSSLGFPMLGTLHG